MRHEAKVWGMKSRPIQLKGRLAEAGIRQVELARELGLSRSLINTCCERGYIPPSLPKFKERVEGFLKKRRIACADVWQFDRDARPGVVKMPRQMQNAKWKMKNSGKEEVKEMNFTKDFLTEEEIRHFALSGDPFFDLDDHSDIYKSPQLKVVERKFFEVIKRHGIMAIVGAVGSGKSTLLRHIIGRLIKDRATRMIMPDSIDRERLCGSNITQAVISQIGCAKMPRTVVERDKMAKQMLEESIRTGADPVMVIDEAHDLKPEAIIALKRLWDSGMIFKLLSVIIIGQGGEDSQGAFGLKRSLLFTNQLKEFSERCYLVDLGLMNGSMGDYLDWRFSKVGGKVRKIFTDDALKMLVKKAPQPQAANNVAMRAMKLAYQDGLLTVTKDHVANVMNQFEVQ